MGASEFYVLCKFDLESMEGTGIDNANMVQHRKTDWVIYHEILETKGKIYIRDLTEIEMDWLTEYAPEYYKVKQKQGA